MRVAKAVKYALQEKAMATWSAMPPPHPGCVEGATICGVAPPDAA